MNIITWQLVNGILLMTSFFSSENRRNESFTEISIKHSKDVLYLPDNVQPLHYKIQLEFFVEDDIFYNGISNVSIRIIHTVQIIYLHAEKLNITHPIILWEHRRGEIIEHRAINYLYIKYKDMLALVFDHLLSPGNYILNMIYTGIIDNNVNGFFKTSHINMKGDREWFIASHTWPIGARRMFPCWDEPRFKAYFTIYIMHHKNYTVLFNVPKPYVLNESHYTKYNNVTHLTTTPAIPIYLIAIVLYNMPNIAFISSRSEQRQDKKFAQYVIGTLTHYFEDEWGEFKKSLILRHVVIPGLLDDDMAKWALVCYREGDIVYNEELDPVARKMNVLYLMGRKISRAWLSTIVSPSWWSYLWLNEGIAVFFCIQDVVNKIIYRMSDLLIVQTLQESLHLDVQSIMNPLTSEIKSSSDIMNSVFSFSYYVKAPAIMRMLHRVLGDKVFRNGINRYLKRHSARSASLNDFWSDMQVAHSEVSTRSEFNIKDTMDPWVKQTSYPLLLVSRHNKYVNVSNILPRNASENWGIPVTYTTQTHLDFSYSSPVIWLRREQPLNTSYSEDDWVIFNLRHTGYYRVNYDDESWLRIARYLNSEKYIKIHVLNRAQIIDDAFHFMIMGQLNASIFWELTNYLSNETDYIAWYPMIKAIESISYIFPFPESKIFKIKILSQLGPLLQKIGYEEGPNDDFLNQCLRQEAAKWACVLDDPECKKEAAAKLQWHLVEPIDNKLLPWWRKWTYCNGLMIPNFEKLFNKYMLEFSTQGDTESLEPLVCSYEYHPIVFLFTGLRDTLKFAVGKQFLKYKKHFVSLFHHLIRRHAKRDTALNDILYMWKAFKPKAISTMVALCDIINHVYSSNQLDKINKFVNNRECLNELRKLQQINDWSDSYVKSTISYLKIKISVRRAQLKKHIDSYLPLKL